MNINAMITSMIFFPDKTFNEFPEDYGLNFEDVHLMVNDDVQLHGWFLPASGEEKGTILFFHGNAGNISHRLFKVKGWVERGFSVFMIDYRGYGKSAGTIKHGKDIMEDAFVSFHWLTHAKRIPAEEVIVYGESLGTHPAIRIASEYKLRALILEAPFTSFVELGKIHYPLVPSALIRNFAFSNQDFVSQIKAPVFFLHGTQDEICPHQMARKLFEIAPEPKEFWSISGGNHNDLPMAVGSAFWEKPYQFLMKQ